MDTSPDLEIRGASSEFFREVARGLVLERGPLPHFQYVHLEDGSSYVVWDKLGEFWVSPNGSAIACRHFGQTDAAFQVYLLNQAVSFALIKTGQEPLHATAVVIDGEAVAFMGRSGFGKSSLAACFLHAGYYVLTDDLLLTQRTSQDLLAYPGPPRIKLFPAMARRFLGRGVSAVPMNAWTQKMVIPMTREQHCAEAVPLRAIYALVSPRNVSRRQTIRAEALSASEAFVELTAASFNYVITDPQRLRRQFNEMTRVATAVPVRKLSYPRRICALEDVRDAILADCRNDLRETVACAG